MIVNTQRVFARLLAKMQISVICDVGSMDGTDALIFRESVPHARIYAFEPNPANFRLMEANRALPQRNIQVVPLAVTNHDGEAKLFLVEANYSQRDYRRGMSSLYQRSGPWAPAAVVPVKTGRLDTFLADKCASNSRVALWIDTEGKAFEVVEGIAGIAEQVYLLHVEVETTPCIGSDQKLYPDVRALLQRLGFAEAATDQASDGSQFNALFVRCDLPAMMKIMTRMCVMCARLRYLLVGTFRKACPACLRHYQARRAAARSRRLGLP
jgi:FkbM family methyltransferase